MSGSGSHHAAGGRGAKTSWRKVAGWTAFFLVLLVVVRPLAVSLFSGRIQVGRETTFIEGPLTDDGRIDYFAALNERLSRGVTVENNAAVPLVRAFGPEIVDAVVREAYFQRLGIEAPPPADDYAVDSIAFFDRKHDRYEEGYGERREAFDEHVSRARTRPWSADEFPEVAEWLDANAAALEWIVEAAARPRLYSPLVSASDELIAAELPLAQAAREAARLLTTRAMRRLDEGDVAGAWSDLLACHRLARLVGEGVTLIERLVGCALHAVACAGDERLRQSGRLTAEQARRCLAELDALEPLPRMVEAIDAGERLMSLDSIQTLARGRITWDWNLVLRMTNAHFDVLIETMQADGHAERARRIQELEEKLQQEADIKREPLKLALKAVLDWRRTVSRQMGSVLLVLYTPAVEQACVAETRADARQHLTRLGFALAGWDAEHGEYPESLDLLAPGWLVEVPLDPFVDEPFRYERTADGYRLYSVGENMLDDGGVGHDARPPRDDLLIEMPGAVEQRDEDVPAEG